MSEQTVEKGSALSEIAEALANALTDRPQRCGHSSDPMCCPHENFPTLAEFFDPEVDATACGRDDGYGRCGRPAGHRDDGIHAVLIGGGSDPVSDPEGWFVFGDDIEKPEYRFLKLEADR